MWKYQDSGFNGVAMVPIGTAQDFEKQGCIGDEGVSGILTCGLQIPEEISVSADTLINKQSTENPHSLRVFQGAVTPDLTLGFWSPSPSLSCFHVSGDKHTVHALPSVASQNGDSRAQ